MDRLNPNELKVWCSRPESNRYDLAIDGFSYLPQLSLPLRVQRLGSGLSLHRSLSALGAARLVSTPSELLRLGSGLASACAGSVPRLWAVLLSAFPQRHSTRISLFIAVNGDLFFIHQLVQNGLCFFRKRFKLNACILDVLI